ncbi:hypothetical protein AB6N24_18480 [Cellulomonas sp. 179-A 4D5 NHS]|uniref:hypothetical protein n=1 Tax=Cellulomonas sp. 179-A 4D5 NHS TaxID=3142378 RepID=UPI0039A2C1E8
MDEVVDEHIGLLTRVGDTRAGTGCWRRPSPSATYARAVSTYSSRPWNGQHT